MNKLLMLMLVGSLCGACGTSPGTSDTAAAPQPAGAKPQGDGRPKLWLTAEAGEGSTVTVKVNFEKGSSLGAPRVADIRIAHSSNLKLVGATASASAVGAHKELTTIEPQPDVIRLVLMSRNVEQFASGELVKVELKREGAGEAKLDLLMDQPAFAPAESMQGLTIGDPIKL